MRGVADGRGAGAADRQGGSRGARGVESAQGVVRVALAARSAADRAKLSRLLAGFNRVRIVGSVADPADAGGLAADMVVAVASPNEDGWRSGAPHLRVGSLPILFLVAVPDDRMVIGARGPGSPPISYLPENAGRAELEAAVVAAAAGLIVVHPSLASTSRGGREAASAIPSGRPTVGSELITPREREVLRMIAEGLPNKAIAAELGITSHTVKFHIASLMQKLDAGSRTEAVTIGLRRGIILL